MNISSGMDEEDGEETEDFLSLPYMDPILLGLKKEGDERFQAQLYEEAAAFYTFAINYPYMDDVIAEKLFHKRAVCFYEMGEYLEAIQDCETAIELAYCSNNTNLLANSVFIKMKAIVCLGDFVPAFKLAVWCKHLRPNCEKTKASLNDLKEKVREAFTADRSLVQEVLEAMIDFAEMLNIDDNTRVLALESYTELLELLDFIFLHGVLLRQAETLMNLGRYGEAEDICAKILWIRKGDLKTLELRTEIMQRLMERELKQAKETKQRPEVAEENPVAVVINEKAERRTKKNRKKKEKKKEKKKVQQQKEESSGVNQAEDSDDGDFISVQNSLCPVVSTAIASTSTSNVQKQFGERSSGLDWIDAPPGQEFQSVAEVKALPLTPELRTSQLQGIPPSGGFRKNNSASTTEVRRSFFGDFPNLAEGTVKPLANSMHMGTSGNAWVNVNQPDASLPNSSPFQGEVRPRNPTNEKLQSVFSQGIPCQTGGSTSFACFTSAGQSDWSSDPVTFSQSLPTKSAARKLSLVPLPGLNGPIKIPEGVYVVCEHFLQNIIRAKTCQFCEECSILKYAAWNKNHSRWQVMRPYPRLELPPRAIFEVCMHFASDRPCLKEPCTFPHGEQETIMWTLERQGLLASPEESLQFMRANAAEVSMIMEPVMQENGLSSVPLDIPVNRGDAMACFGSSTMDEFSDLKAVSSQSATTGDSNNTSVSICYSPLETCGGSFEAVTHSEVPVVTTSHVSCIEAFPSQSSTADSSESSTSPARSSVRKQSKRTLTPFPPREKSIITTSHEGHTEAVSSQSSLTDSSECTTFPTWSSVVKGSPKPSAVAVSPSTKNAIGTSSTLSKKPCLKNPCSFAHSQPELTTWTIKKKKILPSPRETLTGSSGSVQSTSKEISSTMKPAVQLRYRPSPSGVTNGSYSLCRSFYTRERCRYGRGCIYAHSPEELKEWEQECDRKRKEKLGKELEEKEEIGSLEMASKTLKGPTKDMVYSLPGVKVSSNNLATVKISHRGEEGHHMFHWEFTVKFEISEVGKLCEIDLLHRYHDCYRLTKITGFLNDVQIFSEVPKERWSYNLPSGTCNDIKEGQMKVVVSLSFQTTTSNRTYTQCLRFDFGKKPFLLKGLNVDIASEEALDTLSATRQELKLHSSVWTEGSVHIVPWPETIDMTSQDLLLLKKYKLPERIENIVSAQIIDGNFTMDNYKRVMHQLLFTEELFMKKTISRFVLQNVQLDCQQSISNDWSGVVYAGIGELFGIVKFQDNESLQPDDTAGRLLTRNVNSAWIKMPGIGSSSQKVYETLVHKVENECFALKLPSQMCSDLKVSDGSQIFVDVQFQLNRKLLCYWHAAIDWLGPIQLSLLFPTPDEMQIKQEERRSRGARNWLPLDPRLNTNQREVIKRILAAGNTSSPLVVFGPFGTGKTFTLNQAIRHLVAKKHNRILLCTHTNSAADIHVRLLHDYLKKESVLKATRPLRIYQTDRRINADSEVARMYGLIANNAYVLPTRDDVIRHRVVITTLAMSQHLLQLQLNHGFFTHILVDEAAQALEPEALIPLALAGPNTKVVFTGDHMQMGPEVYSRYARDWGLQRSLPERLFDYYYQKKPSDDSVMFLTENYRSHPVILQFPSYNFYGEELIARSKHASHPRFGPLLFFSVHGVEEARENSFINAAEVEEIVKRVELLANDWPVEWKKRDLSQIGVISAYMTQVRAIRTQLRSKGLQDVTVESIHNVQGKEFRALFISTVRTSLTCQSFDQRQGESQSFYWEFLSDPKLLNTAITRAKSLVAVVGDPISLCTAGDCRGNWRDYIKRCHELNTLHGASYEEIKKKVDAPLSKITLNPRACEFVSQSVGVSSKEIKSLKLAPQPEISDSQISSSVEKSDLEVDKNVKASASEIEDWCTTPTETYRSGIERNEIKEDLKHRESTSEEEEEEQDGFNSVKRSEDWLYQHQGDFASQDEPQCRIQSQEGEDIVEQISSHDFEQLPRESFEDETVFPRYLDKIIKALVEKCKATKEKEAFPCGSSENEMFPSATKSSKKDSKSKTGKRSGKRAYQEKSSSLDYSSADYEIRVVNGRQEVHIVNLGFHQTPTDRHQRLSAVSRQEDFPDPQILQRLLVEEPDKYLRCTLRLNSEIIRTAYAEISDTKTPDIKIRGRVRGAFDMDYVVVEKTDCQPSSCHGLSRYQGKVAGVLNHIISPHERQYVCKVDYENPGVMIPINKSMSKIVNLSHNNLNGLPIYRERQDKSERPFEVDVMDFTEALSGKFLFLVQYLHWRPQYQSPAGIVIRKLTQGNTLSDSMKILFAEHGVRDRFSKATVAEVQKKFPPGWSIPVEEDRIREKIEGAFTIDPDNCKDLDDALTLKQLSDSVVRVGVHIADVSYFVEPGTELDKDAMFRSTSYYPGHGYQSVPMLPRGLSENHCSLLPRKDRLCVSVFLDVSEEGKLVGQPEIRRTIVRSCCQLTYPEAQKVIDSQDTSLLQIPQDVKSNIRTLSSLAQRRRKLRLRDASFDRWSNSDYGEDFEAHELVEEMMLLANEEIAKFLSTSQTISERAPLRTQLPPKDHKLDDWVRQHGLFTKYSLFLRGFYSEETLSKMANKAIISEASEFKVQESVWSELCNAAETGDQAKLHKLICNESNHPQLAVANSQFRRIQPKSQYVCKSDQPEENVAHFSLGMACYTQFTSPIRRYIDLQVHRLVLHVISQSPNAKIPSKDQVAKVCRRSTFAQDNSNKFEKASKKVHLAAKLKDKSHETTAVIALIDTDKEFTLEILNREYNHLSTRQRKVKLSSLNPFAVELVQSGLEILLTWKVRLYIAPEGNVIEELEKERKKIALLLSEGAVSNREVLNLPAKNWLEIVQAFQEGDYGNVKTMIRQTERVRQLASQSNRHGKPHKTSKDEKAGINLEHFYEKKLSLRKFDIVSIQWTAHMTHGVFHPEIQLFRINPSVNICIEHRKYPRDCFSTTARYQASRRTYACLEQYIEAWKPVLAMEAATSTVEESDEFTIYHLKIAWKKDIRGKLEGSFSLQDEYCSSRQIEFHAGDFVCVRVREDSYMKKSDSESNFAQREKTETEGGTNLLNEDQFSGTSSIPPSSVRGKPHREPTCASESFWVGHCIINHGCTKQLSDKVTLKVVTMDLHQSASIFPEEMLNGAEYLSALTVIHRPLPHRRMFAALSSLPSASQLAHSICMGHEPNQDFGPPPSSHLSIVREHPNCGFKPLNQYQEEAVKEALVKPFTLVQGPPGTGKTVTGVHIAYWFVKRNMQQRQDDLDLALPDSDDQPKAPPQVIYCGPSNKSVDVVAKYMLKIPDLKIIRVYGDRREQAEFPIPNKRQPLKNSTDDNNQISKDNNELKAVSLHHVIRRSPCPFAAELEEYERKFDEDRKNDLRTSDTEVKEYRELIGQAEKWALQKTGV